MPSVITSGVESALLYPAQYEIVDSTELKLINNKISLENYKFNYLTKKRFNKINDIMLTTYEVKKSNRNINSISISFRKPGNYYLDNIAF